jgi:digeranylgeranylglycerophospholipid reductase
MVRTIEVDCLVIGAGPGGSVAAREVAERGHSTLLIEKRAEIGIPVRCGEGIAGSVLKMLGLSPDPAFVAAKVEGARIFSPGGSSVTLGKEIMRREEGYILRRDIFDRELARMAVRAGSDVMVMCEALGFKREGGKAIVPCRRLGERFDVRASVVVGADGFEAQVGRWGGLDTNLSLRDFDSCIQYQMVRKGADERYCDFYLGGKVAPGGYVWCFPKGGGLFNVGIGINGSMMDGMAAPKRYLDSFISRNEDFKSGKVLEVNAGGVSVGLPLERTVADNLVLVGDAARMIDPLTGGGIYTACYSALRAGEVVSDAIAAGSCSEADLFPYEKAWRDHLEPALVRDYLAKEKFLDVTDEVLDTVIGALSIRPPSELSIFEILRVIKEKFPGIASELNL